MTILKSISTETVADSLLVVLICYLDVSIVDFGITVKSIRRQQ